MIFNSISSRPKVYKQRLLMLCSTCFPDPQYATEKPWVAIHPAGNKTFDTWREAYNYARYPVIMMNGVAA